jgi:hypothetical protein
MSGHRAVSYLPCTCFSHSLLAGIIKTNIPSIRCHGEAIFPGVIDAETGKSIINGKSITGFTTEAEYDMHIMDPIRSWGEPLIDEWAEKLGAKCTSVFSAFVGFESIPGFGHENNGC